jgi:hypothetical protein
MHDPAKIDGVLLEVALDPQPEKVVVMATTRSPIMIAGKIHFGINTLFSLTNRATP